MAISLHFSRISTRTELLRPETRIFRQRKPSSVRCSAAGEAATSSSVESQDFDAKVFRHNLTRSKNYNRKGFGHKEETLEQMSQEYTDRGMNFVKLENLG
ncbi:UNVERIFIED_CONTAM: 4-hydroxy-3-methylbut-2-enyl diphosphate reductase, chloroplastic [Sesamum radiatum]|uniref:4-hydroxy-3-methylbut-2-enyl diphosphate reductase, chloroplastic n=1 Tax=Sesamum radiatum TaxID=300843 RepID=A0AAW2U5R8_SESRA